MPGLLPKKVHRNKERETQFGDGTAWHLPGFPIPEGLAAKVSLFPWAQRGHGSEPSREAQYKFLLLWDGAVTWPAATVLHGGFQTYSNYILEVCK